MQSDSFSIKLTKSRLVKGFVAVPAKYAGLFPSRAGPINILLDDGSAAGSHTYLPDDRRVKERRIFGLARWFAQHDMRHGDSATIAVLDRHRSIYRFTLDRHVQVQEAQAARAAMLQAQTDAVALAQLEVLAQVRKMKRQPAAREELLRIAGESAYAPRDRVNSGSSENYRAVIPAVRALLGALHQGKCQLCAFTFAARNGCAYFEVNHLDPDVADHPANLLVVCPNCHAMFEHAEVEGLERTGGWPTAVSINGKRCVIRQPLCGEPLMHIATLVQCFFLISAQTGLLIGSASMVYSLN